jgi:RNA polymerase sigma-70 factor (ECF subfamily)
MSKTCFKMSETEKEFAQIVREHKTTIYTVCYMFSKDKEEVEDLFQDILIALWQGLDSFRGESNIRSWIYRISLNTCISAERKRRRRRESTRLDMNINLFSDTDEDSRQAQMLRERIGKLGVFDRAIILLWLENLSYEEIGAIVGITAKNVSVRLVRIREQLKNMSNDK